MRKAIGFLAMSLIVASFLAPATAHSGTTTVWAGDFNWVYADRYGSQQKSPNAIGLNAYAEELTPAVAAKIALPVGAMIRSVRVYFSGTNAGSISCGLSSFDGTNNVAIASLPATPLLGGMQNRAVPLVSGTDRRVRGGRIYTISAELVGPFTKLHKVVVRY